MKRYKQIERTRRSLMMNILSGFCLDISITLMCQIGTVDALDVVCKRMTFLIVLKWSPDQQMITLRCHFPFGLCVASLCGRTPSIIYGIFPIFYHHNPPTAEMNEFNCPFPRCERCTFPHLISPCISRINMASGRYINEYHRVHHYSNMECVAARTLVNFQYVSPICTQQ